MDTTNESRAVSQFRCYLNSQARSHEDVVLVRLANLRDAVIEDRYGQ